MENQYIRQLSPMFKDFLNRHYKEQYTPHVVIGNDNRVKMFILTLKGWSIFDMEETLSMPEKLFEMHVASKEYVALFRKLLSEEAIYNPNDEMMVEQFVERILLKDKDLKFIKNIKINKKAFVQKKKAALVQRNNGFYMSTVSCIEMTNALRTVECDLISEFSLWDDKLHVVRSIRIPFDFSRLQPTKGGQIVRFFTNPDTSERVVEEGVKQFYSNTRSSVVMAVSNLLNISVHDANFMGDDELSDHFKTAVMYNY